MGALGTDGRYELREQIGQGPRSTVHLATDRRRGAPMIVKRFDPERAPKAAIIKYSESVAALRKAAGPTLALPLEVVAADVDSFAVYTPLVGETLAAALLRGPLQWPRAVEVVASLATTLAAVATATGQTHRALKPTNVWLAQGGGVVVLDLGITSLGDSAPLSRDGRWLEYRAPEQLDGSPGDGRSDVFTLATLLVELTTGAHPFAGATAFQAAQKLSQTPPDLADVTRGMSPAGVREVTKLLTQALASEPDDRPADVASFSALLAYARPIAGTPSSPQPARVEPERPPEPAAPRDPSTLQSLPHLRQLLVQQKAPTTPTIPTPAPPAPAAPPAPPAPPAASEPVPEDIPPAAPRPPSRATPVASRPPASPPPAAATPRPSSRPLQPADPRDLIAPAPDEPPTLAGYEDPPGAASSAPLESSAPSTPPPREEHTVIDRTPPAPRSETVVDFAAPTAAAKKKTRRAEATEALYPGQIDDDDEENRPTVAVMRGPIPILKPGEATMMLPDQPIPDAPATADDKQRTGPSAGIQWTLVAVNAFVVLLVLAALALSLLR